MNLEAVKSKVKLIVNVFNRAFSSLFNKNERTVIFGGWFGNRFADNSKALFLFMSQNKKELGLGNVIFTTNNSKICNQLKISGYHTVLTKTVLSFKYHLTAGYHIVDMGGKDLLRITSCNAVRVNLWHGFPLKKIGYYATNPSFSLQEAIEYNNKREEIGYWNKVYNLVISEKHKELQQHAFGLPDEQMILGLYPRIAYMLGIIDKFYLKTEDEAKNRIEDLLNQNKKIIGYFPTFRDNTEMNKKCADLPNEIYNFLDDNDAYLITKMHFASDIQLDKYNERIINLTPESDVYNFLNYLDVLITDYSSIYFDFLIFYKPIIYYNFDLDYYKNEDRGFLIDYDLYAPGDKAKTVSEVKTALTTALTNPEEYVNKYENSYEETRKLTNMYLSQYTHENMIQLCHRILSIKI